MKGDFSRDTFRPRKHYSSVRMQQGRVQMDADWNEQLDIAAHLARMEAVDVIGPCGAPKVGGGFKVDYISSGSVADLCISPGRIYVDGILCQLEEGTPVPVQAVKGKTVTVSTWTVDDRAWAAGQWVELVSDKQADRLRISAADPAKLQLTFTESLGAWQNAKNVTLRRLATYLSQADYPESEPPSLEKLDRSKAPYLIYLDVWERHVTALEDDWIREKALDGPDTATRFKTVWQVKVQGAPQGQESWNCRERFDALVKELRAACSGRLSARAHKEEGVEEPCILKPGAGYRRLENQLYRVEIHQSGKTGAATFKWSRENGSVVVSWKSALGNQLTVESLGRDKVLGFEGQEWVELTDDTRELRGEAGTLVKLTRAENNVLTIDPTTATGSVKWEDFPLNPKVRRWDMKGNAGALKVEVPDTNDGWIALEDGVEVRFDAAGQYRCGDYWLIPARTTTGDVEWPYSGPQPAHGIHHHYCCLALLSWKVSTGRLINIVGGKVAPGLAASWVVLDDGRKVTFELAPGLVLADGSALTAAKIAKMLSVNKPAITAFKSTKVAGNTITLSLSKANPNLFAELEKIPIGPLGPRVVLPEVHDCRREFPSLTDLPSAGGHGPYRVLRYVGGDGQQGAPGHKLCCPLLVGVEDELGAPVSNAKVRFTAQVKGDTLTEASNPANCGPSIVVATQNGVARVEWEFAKDPQEKSCHSVLAELKQPPAQGSALAVVFEACEAQGKEVTKLPQVRNINWRNDWPLSLGAFNEGLEVTFSVPMNEASITPDTFIVTLELLQFYRPPSASAELEYFKAHLTWVVPGTVAPADDHDQTFRFKPQGIAHEMLETHQDVEAEIHEMAEPIRGRVVLKGNVILDKEGQHLDGEAFGVLSSPTDPETGQSTSFIELNLPSGDGREGGDFESWFYLVEDE